MNTFEANNMIRWSHAAPGAPLYLGPGSRPKWGKTSMITLPEMPPPSTEAEKILVRARLTTPSARTRKPGPALQFSRVPRKLDLAESFLDSHRMPGAARSSTVTYSIVFHAFLLSAALLVPMWFADTLDIHAHNASCAATAACPGGACRGRARSR
jgi:hypothetical protein